MRHLASAGLGWVAASCLLGVSFAPSGQAVADDLSGSDVALRWTFDPDVESAAGHAGGTIHTQFARPDEVAGVEGSAWRSDGFSSWISAPLRLDARSGFTVAGWVALESYPSDREVPMDDLRPASFMNQADEGSGFDLFVDTFGRWGLRLSTSAGERTITVRDFPLTKWVHIAATYDPAAGRAVLFLNGEPVGDMSLGRGSVVELASGEFRVGRSWRDATAGLFRLNGLNAAFDNVLVLRRPISSAEVAREAHRIVPPPASLSLMVPASRFAEDIHRPVYHAMPPANWTNEPHGLIRRGRWWHLFYQRTPNGPFKTQMTWGHMKSRDLVDWTHLPDALRPTLQMDRFGYDMKGIWSGTVVEASDGAAYAFYTSVNHSAGYFNPGISLAVSTDRDLRTWRKLGPLIDKADLRDLRDPAVWFEDGEWRMLVGAALPAGGGLAYYRCGDKPRPGCWIRQPSIAPFAEMDIGSEIWEMPVFEQIGRGRYILLVNPIGRNVSKYGSPATRAVYWIGSWNGSHFRPDDVTPKHLDLIPGHLSPTVARDRHGDLVGIGIVDERRSAAAQMAAGWAHTFSLPRIWRLLADGHTLGQSPTPAVASLRQATGAIDRTLRHFKGDNDIGDLGPALEIKADFDPASTGEPYGLILDQSPDRSEATRLTYDPQRQVLMLVKHTANLERSDEGPRKIAGEYDERAFGKPRTFHVFIDHSVVDVFINGAAAFSFRLYRSDRHCSRFGVTMGSIGNVRVRAWSLDPGQIEYDLNSS